MGIHKFEIITATSGENIFYFPTFLNLGSQYEIHNSKSNTDANLMQIEQQAEHFLFRATLRAKNLYQKLFFQKSVDVWLNNYLPSNSIEIAI